MKLEQVLPFLRDGKTITRTRKTNNSDTMINFVKINNERLEFKFISSCGTEINWAYYSFKTEDVMAYNWEIAG